MGKEAKEAGLGNLGLHDRKHKEYDVSVMPTLSRQSVEPLGGFKDTSLPSAAIPEGSRCEP